jgi:pyruvate carboxylase
VFRKILVANRGEIAVRAFRAAYELGAQTVAIYPYEDRNSIHRQKADEAYQIEADGSPIRAYLSVSEVIRVAKESGADAIYPGYGFLSENPELARAARENSIAFVGPSSEVLELAGDKLNAKLAARRAGVPVLKSTPSSDNPKELAELSGEIGFPLFVKAVAGGGGRGMRKVDSQTDLAAALEASMKEAGGAFGDSRVFLEQAVLRPRHIEIQILADTHGNFMHLFERDCSIQRRNQKVVEIAPAPKLDDELRQKLFEDAISFAKEIRYQNAGTVEFLIETEGPSAGKHVFIEMNPRIQVEHTVTEEITDVDLVQSQLRIAAGESLSDLGLAQATLTQHGFALQCRITTEDPAAGFRPDTGMITTYRSPGGAGIRLDGGTVTTGAEISPHFDSLLVKLIARGRDFPAAVQRARRALAEFRIRGVATNINFLQAVVEDPTFASGELSTRFMEERPELMRARVSQDRGTKVLQWLAEVTVNKPYGERNSRPDPKTKLPRLDLAIEPLSGTRQLLGELGPERFASWLRAEQRVVITDTTFRDAHQSLLATRVRSKDLVAVVPHVARLTPQLLSLEAWGGATYDVALRFLGEDPWDRLAAMSEQLPNICIQMLLRGRNTVGYTPYPIEVTEAFIREAAATGVDIFRIFDALNDVSQMAPAIRAVRDNTSSVAEVGLSYTADLLDPKETLYTIDYWLRLAEAMVGAGAHILAIKDMAGLLRPMAARKLIGALRERFDLPVHLHTHDTAGGQLATLLAAIDAGVDAVDAASAPMAGTTSQPSMSALVAALSNTERDTQIDLDSVCRLEPYWEAVRRVYEPFESGLPGPTGRVYEHEIPGGQLSNLRQQAIALGLGDRFELVEEMYAAANKILGRPPKVTPSSKVVGDLALHLVAVAADPADFESNPQKYDIPDSVVGFMAGELGDPPGGWPEPFRTKVLQGRKIELSTKSVSSEDREVLATGSAKERRAKLSQLLFPALQKQFEKVRATYGNLDSVDTVDYLYGLETDSEHIVELRKGLQLLVGLEAISDADSKGFRTVMTKLNGQLRPVTVRDHSIKFVEASAEKADPTNPSHAAAPFTGVVTPRVSLGEVVEKGQPIASIEAMKMEATIAAPIGGKLVRMGIAGPTPVEGGDLIAVIE